MLAKISILAYLTAAAMLAYALAVATHVVT